MDQLLVIDKSCLVTFKSHPPAFVHIVYVLWWSVSGWLLLFASIQVSFPLLTQLQVWTDCSHAAPSSGASVPLLPSRAVNTMCPDASLRCCEDAALSDWALPAAEASPAFPHSEPRHQEPQQEVQEPRGGLEEQEQDGADVHRRRRGGDDRPVVRRGAALQALLSGKKMFLKD